MFAPVFKNEISLCIFLSQTVLNIGIKIMLIFEETEGLCSSSFAPVKMCCKTIQMYYLAGLEVRSPKSVSLGQD